ncbi:thialysine N-epsilon-acetyltransferase-like isoform X3 [Littorina saxatilis]|uniref:thialysine N-epsilon-acetyltransferase-like isoform X3 n=1 Tax=Littorina saxatilis TaxID=31220 RepID=UPI0038B522F6
MADVTVREATVHDCEEIMRLIKELAEFEKLPEQVRITADVLRKDGFGEDRYFHCLVAEGTSPDGGGEGRVVVGFCLYYYIYSTWEGKSCYMEDLYVIPQCRGKGAGTAMWVEVTKIALSKGCCRLHWAVLDWNTPAIDLYKRRGGVDLTEKEGWHLFRMTKTVMEQFVAQSDGDGKS